MATRACSAAWSIGFKPEAVRVDGVATIEHPAIRRVARTRKLPIWRCPPSSPRRRLSHERARFVPPPFLKYRFRFDPVISLRWETGLGIILSQLMEYLSKRVKAMFGQYLFIHSSLTFGSIPQDITSPDLRATNQEVRDMKIVVRAEFHSAVECGLPSTARPRFHRSSGGARRKYT